MKLNHVGGKKGVDLKLFALSTCPWCKKTKALLDSAGVDYFFVDVDLLSGADRSEAMAIVRKWNPSASFPVLVLDDTKCIIGFREQEIRSALGL
ncbi:MAG TPA: glutaredoxin family protein [Dehalococcoidales bacterium]|nr:glutaredoxin family protein [Dehalococcoidales bacterium]